MPIINYLEHGTYRMSEISYWLSNYSFEYKKLKDDCFCGAKTDGLPCNCKRSSTDNIFMSMYKCLDILNEYHKFEQYARIELEELRAAKENPELIKNWLIKNELNGTCDLVSFLFDYLDYSEDQADIINLLANHNQKEEIDIFVELSDFKNLIEFKEHRHQGRLSSKKI